MPFEYETLVNPILEFGHICEVERLIHKGLALLAVRSTLDDGTLGDDKTPVTSVRRLGFTLFCAVTFSSCAPLCSVQEVISHVQSWNYAGVYSYPFDLLVFLRTRQEQFSLVFLVFTERFTQL